MKIYFYNTYQSSPTGFQLSEYDEAEGELKLINSGNIITEELRSLLFNSGSVSAAGLSASGKEYFVIKDISFSDDKKTVWYVNVAFDTVAGDESLKLFVRNIFADYTGFKKLLSECIRASEETELSYTVDFRALKEWLGEKKDYDKRTTDFYDSPDPLIKKLNMMFTSDVKLSFLALEATENYFYKQNPVFANGSFDLVLDLGEYKHILLKDEELFRNCRDKNTEKEDAQTEASDNEAEAYQKLIKAALITAGILAGALIVKKIISRR